MEKKSPYFSNIRKIWVSNAANYRDSFSIVINNSKKNIEITRRDQLKHVNIWA